MFILTLQLTNFSQLYICVRASLNNMKSSAISVDSWCVSSTKIQ